jgi:hypothetical protein
MSRTTVASDSSIGTELDPNRAIPARSPSASANAAPSTSAASSREHDKWAEWTIRASIASIILQFVYLILMRRLKTIKVPEGQTRTVRRYPLLMVLITIVMLSAAFCVVRTGRLGVQLVHIEGVGPQGKYLDEGDHD